MIIYHYDRHTGEFLGDALADPSPAETGAFLFPAFATTIAPPTTGEHEAAVFIEGTWRLMPDYRGTSWWHIDGMQYSIDDLGIAPANTDLSHDPCPSPNHIYDYNSKIWVIDAVKQKKESST